MGVAAFGKYKLIAELGRGGMADVFLAVQAGPAGSGFRKLTVLKRLRQDFADDPEFVSMLVDEARLAARLNHPNVVQTNEIGEVNGRYFIAMEYLDGQPLHRIQHRAGQRAKSGKPELLTSEQQYVILMDALAGLHHAHELKDYDGTSLQIVHRDMTPHNLFVTYEGQVKIVDFGIAKAAGRATETRPGAIKGKVRYMSWEQAIGHPVDRRADIFAVGVMLWEAAVGKRMWQGMDDLQITQLLLRGDLPPSPRAMKPDVPEAIDKICRTALALRADDRYQTALDFRNELEQHLAEAGILLEARRKLPNAVTDLFEDRRSEIRVVIEKQLAAIVDEAPTYDVDVAAATGAVPTIGTQSQPSISSISVAAEATGATVATATDITKRKNPARRNAFVVVAALGLAGLGAFAWRNVRTNTTTPTAANLTNPAKVQDITLRVNVSPATAKVTIDDGPAHAAPLNMVVKREDREHVLHIVAEGFESKTERVSYAQDVNLTIDLARKADPAAAGTPSGKPTAVNPTPPGPVAGRPVIPTGKPDPKPDPNPHPTAAPPPSTTAATTAPEGTTGKSGRLPLQTDDPWKEKK
jgi:serine/threonine-protein kinase